MTIATQFSGASTLLDVADGVGRVMGDRPLYLRMLKRFYDDYRDGAAPLRAAIAGGDLRLAQRIAHTLKGASGMIGAHMLQWHASGLEIALRNSTFTQPAALDLFDASLISVLEAIGHLLAGEPVVAPRPPPHAQVPATMLVAQLARLLARGDGAAVDLLEQSAASLKACLGEPAFGEVARAANDFDFEGALEALRRVDAGAAGT